MINEIVLSGSIGINRQEDNLTWDRSLGSIHLSNLCMYLGGSMKPTSLPVGMTIVSHLTGKQRSFRCIGIRLEADSSWAVVYKAVKDRDRDLFVHVHCTNEQMERLWAAARNARSKGWDATFIS